jgi:hypothetical protein
MCFNGEFWGVVVMVGIDGKRVLEALDSPRDRRQSGSEKSWRWPGGFVVRPGAPVAASQSG